MKIPFSFGQLFVVFCVKMFLYPILGALLMPLVLGDKFHLTRKDCDVDGSTLVCNISTIPPKFDEIRISKSPHDLNSPTIEFIIQRDLETTLYVHKQFENITFRGRNNQPVQIHLFSSPKTVVFCDMDIVQWSSKC
jgi:hypothetical protein